MQVDRCMNFNCCALCQFNQFTCCFTRPERIEDGEEEAWEGEHNVNTARVTYFLDPTRCWAHAGMLEDKPDATGGRCALQLKFMHLLTCNGLGKLL